LRRAFVVYFNEIGGDMATKRLLDFTPKATLVTADIIYCGNSAASYDEVQTTVAGLVGAYPNLLELGVLSLTASKFLLTNGSSNLIASDTVPAHTLGGEVDADSNAIINLPAPVDNGDAANKLYVDTAVGSSTTWSEIVGTSVNMVVSNGYILNNAALITATLPVTAAIGSVIILQGKGAGLFSIAQNPGQTINFGSTPTTTGTGGSITATNRYDSIQVVCITADTTFAVLTGPQGSFTVV